MITTAVEALKGSGVKVASVATYFPSGQAPLEVKLADVRSAVELGPTRSTWSSTAARSWRGTTHRSIDEIVAVKEACGEAHLKVILETGELETYDNVRRASVLAMAAGADFIKTTTGKVQPAATLPVTLVMLEAIRDFHAQTGRVVGMKPAGGIKTAKEAIGYLTTLYETLGPAWMTPDLFRFGASSPAQRRADADSQGAHRPILRPRLLHPRLARWRSRPARSPCGPISAVRGRTPWCGASTTRGTASGSTGASRSTTTSSRSSSSTASRPRGRSATPSGRWPRTLAPRAGWQPWAAPDHAWPVTMLPPMEAVQAAKLQSLAAAEELDRGLRRAFWGESRCISLRHVILEVATECDSVDVGRPGRRAG